MEQAFEEARKTIAFYGSTRTYRVSFALEGWTDQQAQLHALSVRGRWDQMASLVSDEMVEAFCVVGRYDQIAAKMKARLAGCTRFTFDMPTENEIQRGICREIVEELQELEEQAADIDGQLKEVLNKIGFGV